MKRILLLYTFLLIFIALNAIAQKEDFVWKIGWNGGIDFNKGQADTFSVPGLNNYMDFANTSICDTSGKLLFYSNGPWVFNKNDSVMLNGDSLMPTNYTNQYSSNHGGLIITGGNIIIQKPEHLQQYYLFHQTIDNDTAGSPDYYLSNIIYESVVDMSLDRGRGAVTNIKNHHLYDNDSLLAGKLDAVRHGNGRDWWLIARKLKSPTFYKWLITPDTILGPMVQSNQPGPGPLADGVLGQSCFSPDGSIYAAVYNTLGYKDVLFYLYHFDRCTGTLEYIYSTSIFDSLGGGAGCAFSPSGQYVYTCTRRSVFQFDTWSANIAASQTLLGTYDGFKCPVAADFGQMRLAPDKKIYIATSNGCGSYNNFIHVIEYPDSGGLSCNFSQHSFAIPTGDAVSFPNLPDYKLGALQGSGCDSLTEIKTINDEKLPLSIYPNPFYDKLTLQPSQEFRSQPFHGSAERIVINVFNDVGEVVYTKQSTLQLQEIDLSGLSGGVYLLQVQMKEKVFMKRIVKILER